MISEEKIYSSHDVLDKSALAFVSLQFLKSLPLKEECFFLSKMYNTIIIKEVGVCDGHSSLKIKTSIKAKAKHIVHLTHLKKYILFRLHLPLSPAKCLKELQQEIQVRLHSYKRNPNQTYPLELLLLLLTAAKTGTVAVPNAYF